MIKTFTLSIFLYLFLALSVSAQQKSRFGLKAGVNVAWQARANNYREFIPLVSTHLTGFTEVQLTERFFLQPGISLQGKGMSVDSKGAMDGSHGKVHMLYMEIPVNLLYKLKLTNLGTFVLGGGPYAGLGLKGNLFENSENPFRSYEGSNGYGNTDYGVNLSLGTQLNSRLTLTLQQSIGLDNIAPDAYTVPGPADEPIVFKEEIKNRVASVSIGFRF